VFALSWLALAVAVVTLLLGLSRNGLTLIYVSIGASVAAMTLLLAGVIRRPSGKGARGPAPESHPEVE
jgi:hypothetical protein